MTQKCCENKRCGHCIYRMCDIENNNCDCPCHTQSTNQELIKDFKEFNKMREDTNQDWRERWENRFKGIREMIDKHENSLMSTKFAWDEIETFIQQELDRKENDVRSEIMEKISEMKSKNTIGIENRYVLVERNGYNQAIIDILEKI